MGSGGTGTATIGNALGNVGGEENHILTIAELAAHAHSINDPGHFHYGNASTWTLGASVTFNTFGFGAALAALPTSTDLTGITANAAGSSAGHNTIQPSAIVNFVIRYI